MYIMYIVYLYICCTCIFHIYTFQVYFILKNIYFFANIGFSCFIRNGSVSKTGILGYMLLNGIYFD